MKYPKRPSLTVFYDCPKCKLVVRQQTFPNQKYYKVETYMCVKCNLMLTPHIINNQGDLPLEHTAQWYKANQL